MTADSSKHKVQLHWQIVIALVASILISLLVIFITGRDSEFANNIIGICDFFGELFLNALKMVVVPLIATSIISGVMGLGSERNFGRLGLKTIGYYIVTTTVAVCIGLLLVNLIRPGRVDPEVAERMLAQASSVETFAHKAEGSSTKDLLDIFARMVPPNIISAASDNGQLLGLICFSLLFGFFISKLPDHLRDFQKNLWDSLLNVMMMIADMIILFSPYGVFCLVTPKIVGFGFDLVKPVSLFFLTVLLALGVQFFVIMSLFLFFIGRVNPINHFKAMAPALLTAFSTSSSVSTLPLTLECVEKQAGVSNRVASFTLPLGATVNMNGTALYECIVVIFISQFSSIVNPSLELGLVSQFMVVMLAVLTSIGVAGIPSASLVAIAIILGVFDLPLEYMGLVLVVDRILDMCRSAVNVFSDSVGAVVIARTEGESEFYPEDGYI